MTNSDISSRLDLKGVQSTVNRVLIYRTLYESVKALSLTELEVLLDPMSKSSISRVLALFTEQDVVHSFEDGRGVVHYELCTDEGICVHDDAHVHFYCEQCHQSFCLTDIPIPPVDIPAGYVQQGVSFVIKGLCPNCAGNVV